MYVVGKIKTTHGIKGELKVKNLSDFNRFFVGNILFILNDNKKEKLTIKSVRNQNDLLLIKFEGFDDMNSVLRLKSRDLFTDDKPMDIELNNEEFTYSNLIGLKVYFNDNEYIGMVKSILEVANGQILEVFKENDKKVLIPFVKAIVLEVYDDKIIVDKLDGLV